MPPVVRFSGRDKRSEIAFNVAMVAGGTLLVLLAAAQVPSDLTALWVLIGYTCYAVVATLVLVLGQLLTHQLPTMAEGTFDGAPALVVRSWRAPWWHSHALDLGLAVTGTTLAVMGLTAGGGLALPGTAAGLGGLWFLVRVLLALLGRRRPPTLWLTREEVVIDTPAGRGRAARSKIRRLRSRAGRLVIELDGPARWELCPRPWRGSRRPEPGALVLDCSDTGHRATDLAEWIEQSWRGAAAPDLGFENRSEGS